MQPRVVDKSGKRVEFENNRNKNFVEHCDILIWEESFLKDRMICMNFWDPYLLSEQSARKPCTNQGTVVLGI